MRIKDAWGLVGLMGEEQHLPISSTGGGEVSLFVLNNKKGVVLQYNISKLYTIPRTYPVLILKTQLGGRTEQQIASANNVTFQKSNTSQLEKRIHSHEKCHRAKLCHRIIHSHDI